MRPTKKRYELAKNASRFHKKVGELLQESIYKHMTILQEYSVKKINPDYKNGREKIDWVIVDLKVAIEVHGQQHYVPATFGGISKGEAGTNFRKQVLRDEKKKTAVLEAGWIYLAISYEEIDNLTSDILVEKINEASDEAMDFEPKKKNPPKRTKNKKQKETPIDIYEHGISAALEKIKRLGEKS